jgi:hypothetical protein
MKMLKKSEFAIAGLLGFALLSMVAAQSGGPFTITKSVIATGGGRSTAGVFTLDGTIGEPLAGTVSTGGTFKVSGGFWGGGSAAAAGGIKGDVAPRPTGDGVVQSNDVVQVQRFQIGLDTITLGSNEFLRADSAPLNTGGDGLIQTNDVVQTQRFQIGLDQLQNVPTAPPDETASLLAPKEAGLIDVISDSKATHIAGIRPMPKESPGRAIRLESPITMNAGEITLNILVDALGDEAGYGFTLSYDPAVVASPKIAVGAAGGSRLCNTSISGRIMCSMMNFSNSSPGGSSDQIAEIPAGSSQVLATITFKLAANAQPETASIRLTNANASNDVAELLLITNK